MEKFYLSSFNGYIYKSNKEGVFFYRDGWRVSNFNKLDIFIDWILGFSLFKKIDEHRAQYELIKRKYEHLIIK